MKRAVPLAKQSKKAQKAYNRTKARQETHSLIRNGGKEWANGASARRYSCGSYGI